MMKSGAFQLDLQHFAFFEMLMKVNSVSAAADMMGISQPQASRCLGRLRAAFHDDLFVRGAAGMVPTARALQVSERVHELVELAYEFDSDDRGFDPDIESREFVVACPDIGQWGIMHAFTRYMFEFPKIRLRTITVADIDLPHILEAGDADLAYGPYPLLRGSMRKQLVHSGQYLCMCRPSHPFAQSPSLQTFKQSDHIIYQSSTCVKIYKDIAKALSEVVAPERFRIFSGSYMAALFSLDSADLIITSPSLLLRHEMSRLGLVSMPPPFKLPDFEIHQFWHSRNHRDAGHAWFRSTLRAALLAADSIPRDFDQTLNREPDSGVKT